MQKEPPRGFLRKRCSENMQQIYRRTPMPKCDINKLALQLFWNRTSAWLFSCKFAAYLQNTFPKNIWEQLLLNIVTPWKHSKIRGFSDIFFLTEVFIRIIYEWFSCATFCFDLFLFHFCIVDLNWLTFQWLRLFVQQ